MFVTVRLILCNKYPYGGSGTCEDIKMTFRDKYGDLLNWVELAMDKDL